VLKKSQKFGFEPESADFRNLEFPKPLTSLKSNFRWFEEIHEIAPSNDFFNSQPPS